MSKAKITTPLPPPPSPYTTDPHAITNLSEAERKMYDEVLGYFTKEEPVYTLPNDEKGELNEDEKFWLSRECILRFLRASKWKVSTAITRLETTLKWRREFGIEDVVTAKHVEPEAVTGKEILFGFDIKGRPSFYMIPSRQNTDEPTRQIQFAFWMIERCIDMMEPGVENIGLLINFADKAKNPSLSVARSVLSILQSHYPERLGLAHIINIPFLVTAFFKLIMPFVDPVTREKIKFNPDVIKENLFEPGQVMKDWWGGDVDFEYVHEDYWGSLVGLCEERKRRWKEAWKGLGGKVGVSEWEYKTKSGVDAVDLKEEEKKDEAKATNIAVAAILAETAVLTPSPDVGANGQSPSTVASHGTSTTATTGAGAVAGGEAAAGGDAGAAGGDGGGDGGE